MAAFVIVSRGEPCAVYIDDKDEDRVKDFANVNDRNSMRPDKCGVFVPNRSERCRYREYGAWHVVWKADRVDAVAANVIIGYRRGGYKTRQVKLHNYIMGEIPNCKVVKHRDGNPLNNRRENLLLYQKYQTVDIATMPKRKMGNVCRGCKNEKTCRQVPIRKKDGKKYAV